MKADLHVVLLDRGGLTADRNHGGLNSTPITGRILLFFPRYKWLGFGFFGRVVCGSIQLQTFFNLTHL